MGKIHPFGRGFQYQIRTIPEQKKQQNIDPGKYEAVDFPGSPGIGVSSSTEMDGCLFRQEKVRYRIEEKCQEKDD